MTREQAQLVIKHLDIVKHFAEGGALDHVGHDWAGREMKPSPVFKGIIINCLPMYRKADRPNMTVEMKHYCSRWCPLKKEKNETVTCDGLGSGDGLRHKAGNV